MTKVRRNKRLITSIASATIVLGSGTVYAFSSDPFGTSQVGRQANDSSLVPSNQFITSAGDQAEFHGNPLNAVVSPDGKTGVVLTSSGLNVMDLETNQFTATIPVGNSSTGTLSVVDLSTNTVINWSSAWVEIML